MLTNCNCENTQNAEGLTLLILVVSTKPRSLCTKESVTGIRFRENRRYSEDKNACKTTGNVNPSFSRLWRGHIQVTCTPNTMPGQKRAITWQRKACSEAPSHKNKSSTRAPQNLLSKLVPLYHALHTHHTIAINQGEKRTRKPPNQYRCKHDSS